MDKVDWSKVPEGTQVVAQYKDFRINYLKYYGGEFTWNGDWREIKPKDKWTILEHKRYGWDVQLNPVYPQDVEDFDYDGNAVKYLNGRKLIWDVDKQTWTV